MLNNFFHTFDFVKFFRKRKEKKMYKAQIRGFLNSIVPFSDMDWGLFEKRLYYKEFEKNELLLRAGEVENFMYFLVDGVTRIFQYKNDIEYTLRFNFPIAPFNSYASFITQTPSLINVEALTDIKILRVSYSDMQSLYEESKMAERLGRRLIELLYVQREIKELQMHSKTAEDYYCELLNANDSLVQHIPQKHLASYLGITPESLSRIRKKL
jgi:CRP-like cAMP-binding protein